ncbi:hypothetical protein GPECTOR_185g277 [Gonium pectorale]|uniref:DUF2177 domain-containing protein n=1 Tax=Gonium pectorale TaxID=33097 RepID=A0A150FX44_GONPE|nr:hypothetical protein GPECTOR_185g277 [Gonium pectorale]|eukprot:KXZ42194.1 hypothetical protein GPECTOR_185g277 [Gonium pectorale]
MYQSLEEPAVAPQMPPGILNIPAWKSVCLVFIPSLVAFVLLDVTWISLVAGSIYKTVLGDVLRPTPDIPSGVLAWLCIVGTLYLFALPSSKNGLTALRQGALLGAGLYGCYEFTNLSILVPWTWGLALADTAWGSFVCGVACWIQHSLHRRVARG